jgi:hypothetical protein
MGISAALAILGGIIALVGIVNPKRQVPCVDCPGGALAPANIEVARMPTPAPPPPSAPAEAPSPG